jgi:hypothetical protein
VIPAELAPWIWPAVWTAVTAIFAAVVAWLVIRIRARAAADSFRPDLVIGQLVLTDEVKVGSVVFRNCRLIDIENVGKGPAVGVSVRFGVDDQPMNIGHSLSDSLAPNERIAESSASFNFGAQPPQVYRIHLTCEDARGRRHITEFSYDRATQREGDLTVKLLSRTVTDAGST